MQTVFLMGHLLSTGAVWGGGEGKPVSERLQKFSCILEVLRKQRQFRISTFNKCIQIVKDRDGLILNENCYLAPILLSPPGWLSGKEPTCQCKRHGFDPWVGKIPWRRKWQPTLVFLPGKCYGQKEPGELQSMGSQKESDVTERLTQELLSPSLCLLNRKGKDQGEMTLTSDSAFFSTQSTVHSQN